MSRHNPRIAFDENILTAPGGPLNRRAWRAEVSVFFSPRSGRIYLLGADPGSPWILQGNLVTRGEGWPPSGDDQLIPLCTVPAQIDAPERLAMLLSNTAVIPQTWHQLGIWHGGVQADHQLRYRIIPKARDILSLSAWARPILDDAVALAGRQLASSLRRDIPPGSDPSDD